MNNVLIWGTGNYADKTLKGLKNVNIIGFIETKKTKNEYCSYPVFSISEIPKIYDIILIANTYSDEIYKICINEKIDLSKVCFVRKGKMNIDVLKNLEMAKQIMDSDMYSAICAEYGVIEDDWISRDAEIYSVMNERENFKINTIENYYIYSDKFALAGSVNSYFLQDLWAAKKVFNNNPSKHFDIGSRIDGFIGNLLSFRDNVYLIDIRPLDRIVEGLNFIKADATNLEVFPDNSIESISALCSLEHFGLGRYGDKIDPEACFKCIYAICKKVKTNGKIYIAVPIGCEHIEFNAHRVFYASTIVDAFKSCDLVEFSCTSKGYIEYNVDICKYDSDYSLGGERFGLFEFRKR